MTHVESFNHLKCFMYYFKLTLILVSSQLFSWTICHFTQGYWKNEMFLFVWDLVARRLLKRFELKSRTLLLKGFSLYFEVWRFSGSICNDFIAVLM